MCLRGMVRAIHHWSLSHRPSRKVEIQGEKTENAAGSEEGVNLREKKNQDLYDRFFGRMRGRFDIIN